MFATKVDNCEQKFISRVIRTNERLANNAGTDANEKKSKKKKTTTKNSNELRQEYIYPIQTGNHRFN